MTAAMVVVLTAMGTTEVRGKEREIHKVQGNLIIAITIACTKRTPAALYTSAMAMAPLFPIVFLLNTSSVTPVLSLICTASAVAEVGPRLTLWRSKIKQSGGILACA